MQAHYRQAAKDLALYLLISAIVLGPILLAVIYDWHPNTVLKVMTGVAYTTALFATFLYRTRQYWHSPSYKLGTLTVFTAHCALVILLARQETVSPWLPGPVVILEFGLLGLATKELRKHFASRTD